jgi:hypothetical protein
MKQLLAAVVACGMMICGTAGKTAAGQFDNIISSAEVEMVTGLTGVKQVPRDRTSKFKNGDINFIASGDRPVLMIEFRPVFVFEAMKADSGYFKKSIPGLAEEAFTSPAFDPQFSVNLRKGKYVAVITTHIDPKDKKSTVLSLDHLTSLAKLVASRM